MPIQVSTTCAGMQAVGDRLWRGFAHRTREVSKIICVGVEMFLCLYKSMGIVQGCEKIWELLAAVLCLYKVFVLWEWRDAAMPVQGIYEEVQR
ncbi:hypothetical protein [Anabaena sp. CCY 0017]|uniref:hypothetical protein n=1 Tax=Anabaena sp. CCY 0017 TaxID=3103866 RepID=UPI0039C658CE